MSYQEFLSWVAYRERFGSLNPIHRNHLEFAVLGHRIINFVAGGKVDLEDLLLYPKVSLQDEVSESEEMDEAQKEVQAVIQAFKPLAASSGRKKYNRTPN